MSRKLILSSVLSLGLLLLVNSVFAQQPRPTPTNVPPPGEGGGTEESEQRGSISGFIYLDVNRDGQCFNTGVEGEVPVPGVDVQFVSSDRETIITQFSGENGDFGLYAAGQSYWEVTVMPEEGWVATTESTVFVPVYPETLNHENVNFCLTEGGGVNAIINLPGANSAVILPESGASAVQIEAQNNLNLIVAISVGIGLALILSGYILERRRKSLKAQPLQNGAEEN